MSSRVFVSRPDGCAVHVSGWLELPSGAAITRLPIADNDMQTFARLGHGPAQDWCRARGYRLPTIAELDQLHARGTWIQPNPMPTVDMLQAEGIGITQYAAINQFRTANMRSFAWAELHDREVWRRLESAGWTGGAIANAGKHWAESGLIYGWWRLNGQRIQPASGAHRDDPTYVDYGTTFHAVNPAMTPRRTRPGEKGEAVKLWQTWLASKGHDVGAIDGKHGAKTEAASLLYESASAKGADGLPFLQAKNYTKANRTSIDWVILHSTENPIRRGTARNVAQWFASPSAPMASCHYVVGPDETIRCVLETDVAWCAPGANRQGIHIEQVGQAHKTNWEADGPGELDGLQTLKRSAALVREICDRWQIPMERLDPAALRAGKRGITTHAATTEAFKQGSHVDPGGVGDARWPWDLFLQMVRG